MSHHFAPSHGKGSSPFSPISSSASAERAKLRQIRGTRLQAIQRSSDRKVKDLEKARDSLLMNSPRYDYKTRQTQQVNEYALKDLLDETATARQSNDELAAEIKTIKEDYEKYDDWYLSEKANADCNRLHRKFIQERYELMEFKYDKRLSELDLQISEQRSDIEVKVPPKEEETSTINTKQQDKEYLRDLKEYEACVEDTRELLEQLSVLEGENKHLCTKVANARAQELEMQKVITKLKYDMSKQKDEVYKLKLEVKRAERRRVMHGGS
eukprot:CFRG7484T1